VLDIHGCVDAYWDGYLDHRIYTSVYVFKLFGGEIGCMLKIQSIVELSTTKVEYMVVTHESTEVVWL
jgi:hypothetical protein